MRRDLSKFHWQTPPLIALSVRTCRSCSTVDTPITRKYKLASLYKLVACTISEPSGARAGNERGHDHEVSALSKAPKMSVSASMRLSRGGADRPHTASRRANARRRVEAATLRVRAVNKVRVYVAKLLRRVTVGEALAVIGNTRRRLRAPKACGSSVAAIGSGGIDIAMHACCQMRARRAALREGARRAVERRQAVLKLKRICPRTALGTTAGRDAK